MARYRSAIIACGTIARCHARGWQGVADVELRAVADTSEQALQEFGEFFGVPPEHRYTDYRTMLDEERPDFVDVCSWHGLHAEMTIAAAAHRPKAIICQKPMALSPGDCDRMLTACAREGVKLLVGHQRRHLAGWLEARKRVAEGVVGTPQQIIIDSGSMLNVMRARRPNTTTSAATPACFGRVALAGRRSRRPGTTRSSTWPRRRSTGSMDGWTTRSAQARRGGRRWRC